jgi:hypothetical protein
MMDDNETHQRRRKDDEKVLDKVNVSVLVTSHKLLISIMLRHRFSSGWWNYNGMAHFNQGRTQIVPSLFPALIPLFINSESRKAQKFLPDFVG